MLIDATADFSTLPSGRFLYVPAGEIPDAEWMGAGDTRVLPLLLPVDRPRLFIKEEIEEVEGDAPLPAGWKRQRLYQYFIQEVHQKLGSVSGKLYLMYCPVPLAEASEYPPMTSIPELSTQTVEAAEKLDATLDLAKLPRLAGAPQRLVVAEEQVEP